jgi:hypothetical protein
MESPKQTLDELFGNPHVRAGISIQAHLGALSDRLPNQKKLSPERLAIETTLLPYFTAFQPPKIRSWALAALTNGDAKSVHVRLGLTAAVVRLPVALRYCPACRAEMLAQQDELYWRRDHQLPGVLVCPRHYVPLADSQIIPAQTGKHEFIAADVNNCPPDPLPPAWANNAITITSLRCIAQASATLLTAPPPALPLARWGEQYRAALMARGFGKGTKINQFALLEAYLTHFGPILDLLPEAAPAAWLEGMTRKHRKAIAPLRHILLRLILEALPISAVASPFGKGPWPCRNPLAPHCGHSVITDCHTHKQGGKTIGVFSCSCGYKFSQAAEPGSRIRILDLGPLFETRLRELLAFAKSLRAAARALSVDPKTVLRHAQRLGLPTPWKAHPKRFTAVNLTSETIRTRWSTAHQNAPHLSLTQLRKLFPAEYFWLYRHDRDWLKTQPPFPIEPSGGRQRHDWQAIDAATAALLRVNAAQLRAETPPVLITRSALERSLGQPGWLDRRLKNLPLCTADLNHLLESREEFQCRRIAWAIEELNRKGLSLKTWRIRRLAGLPKSCAPSVEATLRAVGDST